MNTVILTATARTKQPGRFNEAEFVQGVIYGKGIESSAVKFDTSALNKLIDEKGNKAAVSVEFAGVTMNGVIKDVQRSVIGQAVTHVDIQILG